jgi:hypothetical protein
MRIRLYFRLVVACLLLEVGLSSGALGAQSAPAANSATLREQARAFLQSVAMQDLPAIAEFLPREGDFTYVTTIHDRGGDRRSVWKFAAAERQQAIAHEPLSDAFTINYEAQPVGLFGHEVQMNGTTWKRVSATRFVPPGATIRSRVFVEFRREGTRWVVSRFGDQAYAN